MTRWSTRADRSDGRAVRAVATPGVAAFVLACLLAACGGAIRPAGASGSAVPPVASPSGPAAGVARSAHPSDAGPPAATLVAEGGDPVVGQLGSFTWGGGGSDSPWLPGRPVVVGAGEPLTVNVADGVDVSAWTARRVSAGTSDGTNGVGLGGGPAPITFAAPGPGSWSIQVVVTYADGLGSGAYYWQVTVR